MGLFGMLCTLFTGGVYAHGKIKEAKHDAENREKSRSTNDITYIDSHGRTRLTATGQQVFERGGIIYSNGNIIARPYLNYYEQRNKEEIDRAKSNGQKYAYIYHFKNLNDPHAVVYHKTELETMKMYTLDFNDIGIGNDWYYHIIYQTIRISNPDFFDYKSESITKEKFESLGGIPPKISVQEFRAQKTKAAKDLLKEMNKKW